MTMTVACPMERWSKKKDVHWQTSCLGAGFSGGLEKWIQPNCLLGFGSCEVANGVRLFSLFNRGLQDPVGFQVEMDFGVLL